MTPYLALLTEKRAELHAQLRDREPITVERHADPLDDACQYAAREMAVEERIKLTALLDEVEAAMARIADGTYGVCECGRTIPAYRLMAVPWTAACVRCQAQQEAAAKDARFACGGLLE